MPNEGLRYSRGRNPISLHTFFTVSGIELGSPTASSRFSSRHQAHYLPSVLSSSPKFPAPPPFLVDHPNLLKAGFLSPHTQIVREPLKCGPTILARGIPSVFLYQAQHNSGALPDCTATTPRPSKAPRLQSCSLPRANPRCSPKFAEKSL